MRVSNFWTKHHVPHKPPHPLFGSLTFIQRMNMMAWLVDEYKKYPDSPYFGMWLFWRPALVIRDPQIAKNILVKDFDAFRDRFVSSGTTDPIGGKSIFATNDPLWSSIRRRLTAVFTASKLRALHPLIDGKAKDLVQRIRNDYVNNNKTLSLRELYADFTTDIIGAAAFGVSCDATMTGESVMRNVTKDFSTYSLKRGLEFVTMFFWPELCDVFRVSFFPKKTTDYFREIFKMIVSQRGGWDAKITETRDLLDALLKLRQQLQEDGEESDHDLIISQAAIFLQGGFDTTAVSLTFATYELAFHPEIQEKLYNELHEAYTKAGSLEPTVLTDLPYLNCVIKEGLRKYPAMGFLDRIAVRDYQVDDKLTIKKGTPVYVCAIGMHYDPKYFPNPEQFDPDRFAENEGKLHPFTFMPFGEGPRSCIGMRFAYINLRSGLSNVILNYKVVPRASSPHPRDIQIDPRGIFMAPDRDLVVDFIPRK